jgi:HlyD family secretion protein
MGPLMQEMLLRHGGKFLMALSVGLVALLIVRGPPPVQVLGYAEVAPVRLSSLETAKVLRTLVEPGQVVKKGDVVAELDPTMIQGRMAILKAELERHEAGLMGAKAVAESSIDAARADKAESTTRLGAAREALRIARAAQAERDEQVKAGLASADSLANLEVRAALQRARGEMERFRQQLDYRTTVLRKALARLEGADTEPSDALLEGTRAQSVVGEELALLQTRLEELTLRAPMAARVAALRYRPGEVLPAGEAIADLMPLETTRVIACLPERYPVEVKTGTSVALRGTTGAGIRSGVVVDVVGLISEAPERCKQRPNEIGWVRPVRIEVTGGGLVPGERFDISFGPSKDPGPAPEQASSGESS